MDRVCVRQATPDDGITDLSRVAVVDVATGAVMQLSDRSTYEYQAAFSPKSSAIAYLRPHGPTPLSVYDVFTTTPHGDNADPTQALDRDATQFAWTADGSGVISYAYDHIGVALWLQRIGGSAKRLDIGRLAPTEFNVGRNGSIAFVASTAKTPPEIYLLPNSSAPPKQLTYFNEALRKRTYAKVTEFTWQSPDGEKCDGVLTYALGYQAGKRYPLVVKIHGGPENAATAMYNGFEADLMRQPIATKGYFVFEPNYRGSDNLGNRHERAIYRDPGEGPAKDVMAGLAKLVSLGLVDQGRISIVGHSYGGLATTWLIGHFTGWKSAVVADGAVDPLERGIQPIGRRQPGLDPGFPRRNPVRSQDRGAVPHRLLDHLRRPNHHTHLDPIRDVGRDRPDHRVVPALPRPQGPPRPRPFRSLPGFAPHAGRPGQVRAVRVSDDGVGFEARQVIAAGVK